MEQWWCLAEAVVGLRRLGRRSCFGGEDIISEGATLAKRIGYRWF
jgi:hypothetical protein